MMRRLFLIAAAAVWVLAPQTQTVTVQLLAINDFHGNVEAAEGSSGTIGSTPAGGSEYLATHLARAAAQNPHSIVVAAGDLIGASPLLSALFHDEPAIESLNAMHLAVASVGNHEFDEGWQELKRMQNGGCHQSDGCQDGDEFAGAAFTYLAANVMQGGGPLFPPTSVRTIGGVKIGFIGETLRETPRMVTPNGVRGLEFLDEAATANRHAAELTRQGVHAIVLLIHEGGTQSGSNPNGCAGFSGGLRPILSRLSPAIKVVISGHTHQYYNCTIDGRLVTSAGSFGRMITRATLTIDPTSGLITDARAVNEIVTRTVGKDPTQTRILAKYSPRSAPIANRPVGSISANLTRRTNLAGESALGEVIADAQLAATSAPDKGGAVVAFMNPGGIRADVTTAAADGRARITYGNLFAVQPFSNVLTVVTLTGDALHRLLEEQFDNPSRGSVRLLQVSSGFTYTYALRAPAGRHVDPGSIRLKGIVVQPTDRVRVAANNFLIEGGDGFRVFTEGTDQLGGDLDVDALVAYFLARSPIAPGPLNRIVRAPGS